jgi:hypothetical protein
MLTIDVILLAQQIQHAFELKKDPLNASRVGAPLGVLLNSLLRLALEIFFIVNRWINMPRANSLLVNVSTRRRLNPRFLFDARPQPLRRVRVRVCVPTSVCAHHPLRGRSCAHSSRGWASWTACGAGFSLASPLWSPRHWS